ADEDVSKYGIIKPKGEQIEPGVIHVSDLFEKPSLAEAPSNYAIMGRYVLRPEIFDILESLPPGAGNEIQLTDAIKVLNSQQAVLAYEFEGERYDVGDKFGFVKATVDFALDREDLRDDVRAYLESLTSAELVGKK
ncbi:sugar phosphate nucleotidyltransferase, partial [Thalassobacillus sp. C254]|uniref:sugar phosphate nucleotidyltransferase n=1 Tax=Thalassobacillus sp. C254 TaxID=1225341 RepID=UPI000A5D1401